MDQTRASKRITQVKTQNRGQGSHEPRMPEKEGLDKRQAQRTGTQWRLPWLSRAGESGEAAHPKSFTPTARGPGASWSRLGWQGPMAWRQQQCTRVQTHEIRQLESLSALCQPHTLSLTAKAPCCKALAMGQAPCQEVSDLIPLTAQSRYALHFTDKDAETQVIGPHSC